MTKETLKILVIDDHRLFLEGMRHLLLGLGDGVELDLVDSVAKAIQMIDAGKKYQLLVMDISLPQLDGFSFLKSLNERKLVIPTVVISSSSNLSDIRRVMKLGALGFIHKNTSSEDMLAAVRKVLRGEIYLSDTVWSQLDAYPKPLGAADDVDEPECVEIGARQIEVLQLVVDGMSNKQIAAILNIRESTVKYHVSILFRHLSVSSRTALVKQAAMLDLLNKD